MTGRYKNYLGHQSFLSPWVGARPNWVLLLPPASFKMLAIAVGEGVKAGHAIGDRFNMNDLQHPWTIQTLLLKLGFNMEMNEKQWVNSGVDAPSRRPRAPGARDSTRRAPFRAKAAFCANEQGGRLPSVADGYDTGDGGSGTAKGRARRARAAAVSTARVAASRERRAGRPRRRGPPKRPPAKVPLPRRACRTRAPYRERWVVRTDARSPVGWDEVPTRYVLATKR